MPGEIPSQQSEQTDRMKQYEKLLNPDEPHLGDVQGARVDDDPSQPKVDTQSNEEKLADLARKQIENVADAAARGGMTTEEYSELRDGQVPNPVTDRQLRDIAEAKEAEHRQAA